MWWLAKRQPVLPVKIDAQHHPPQAELLETIRKSLVLSTTPIGEKLA